MEIVAIHSLALVATDKSPFERTLVSLVDLGEAWIAESVPPSEAFSAQGGTPFKVPAYLRSAFVNRAALGGRIKGDARTVASLLHATHAGVLNHELLRNIIHAGHQLHQKMTAFAAAGTGREFIESVEHRSPPIVHSHRRAARGIMRMPLNSAF